MEDQRGVGRGLTERIVGEGRHFTADSTETGILDLCEKFRLEYTRDTIHCSTW